MHLTKNKEFCIIWHAMIDWLYPILLVGKKRPINCRKLLYLFKGDNFRETTLSTTFMKFIYPFKTKLI